MLVRALPRISLSPAARAQLGIFAFAYLLYSAARFVTIGDLSVAQANADWIMNLEDTLSLGIESSVQQALTGTVYLWVLNHLYLAAQLVVLPGALIYLYHRSKPMYERLRNTILATWVLSIVRHLAIDTLRMRRSEPVDPTRLEPLISAYAGPDTPAAAAEHDEDARRLPVRAGVGHFVRSV